MSRMQSLFFFDPNKQHNPRSELDLHIEYMYDWEALQILANANDDVRKVVCICSFLKSDVISKIVQNSQIISLRLCRNRYHGEHEQNPLFYGNVQDDTNFEANSDWELKCRLELFKFCMKHQYNTQFRYEKERIEAIQQVKLARFPLSEDEQPV